MTTETATADIDTEDLTVGETLTVTKDFVTERMIITRIDEPSGAFTGYGPYVLVRSATGRVVGFDRVSLAYGIVEVSR